MTESGSRVGVVSVVSEKDSEKDCVSEKEYVTKEHLVSFMKEMKEMFTEFVGTACKNTDHRVEAINNSQDAENEIPRETPREDNISLYGKSQHSSDDEREIPAGTSSKQQWKTKK